MLFFSLWQNRNYRSKKKTKMKIQKFNEFATTNLCAPLLIKFTNCPVLNEFPDTRKSFSNKIACFFFVLAFSYLLYVCVLREHFQTHTKKKGKFPQTTKTKT